MKLAQLAAIMRRLDTSHIDYQYCSEQHKMTVAGIAGENSVHYYLQELTVPHLLIRNLCLNGPSNHKYEIDFLLIFPSFLICLEVKNITGILDFDDEASQLLRTRADGSVDRFQNPIEQITRHVRLLSTMLPNVPIESAVVIANRNAIINKKSPRIPIFHADYVTSFIEHNFEKYNQNTIDMHEIYHTFTRNHILNSINIKFKLQQLKIGVFCPKCDFNQEMIFRSGTFICPRCRIKDKYAHFYALEDYRLLVDNKISNEQFRKLCNIPSRDAAKRLLSKLAIFKHARYTYYEIPAQILTMYHNKSNDSPMGG
ncbi:nuclease-related domain-containing protein [Solibacillus sp. CAU 1738]|uniref:nuclease-related domain-containing protein n=1 Tax=Solibacillus sp. CAU 1738 TaxID=3140363 RepID=UPI003261B89F